LVDWLIESETGCEADEKAPTFGGGGKRGVAIKTFMPVYTPIPAVIPGTIANIGTIANTG
jgi:hypothetical protein